MVWAVDVDDGICWIFVCCCDVLIWDAIKFVCDWFDVCCWTALTAVFGEGCGTVEAGAGLADACWFDCLLLGETTPPKFKAFRPR